MRYGNFFVFCLMVLTVIWGMLIGKDLSWDVVNHHYYLPYAWINSHVFTDLFASGPQSYQNPLGYFPFYFMVSQGWPSWLIGLSLGTLHALNVLVIYRLARVLWSDQKAAALWSSVAALLAWLSPIFLVLVASTSVDVISSIFVLLGLLIILSPGKAEVTFSWRVFGAGIALALAVSIKLSNLLFVIAFAAVCLAQLAQGRLSWKSAISCGLGFCVGTLLGMGWYCWELYQHFQSPIFPLYNGIFKSPYAPIDNVVSTRFSTGLNIFYKAFEIAEMKRFTYFEGFAPDLRFACLVVLLAIVALLAVRGPFARGVRVRLKAIDLDLLLYFLVIFVLWIMISGNARYVVPMCLLVGVLLARWIYILLGAERGRLAVLIVMSLQAIYTLSTTEFRFVYEPWDAKPFYKVKVDPQLIERPYLHLLLGVQTKASLLSSVGAQGVMVNPLGQFSILEGSPLGQKFDDLRQQWRGRVRAVLPDFLGRSASDIEKGRVQINKMLYRLGYSVDLSQCLKFKFERDKPVPGSLVSFIQQNNMFSDYPQTQSSISCMLVERTDRDLEFEASRDRANKAFEVIEAACPKLYGPRNGVTEWGNEAWERYYPNTDSSVLVSEERGVVARLLRSAIDREIGSYKDVLAGKGVFDCARPSMLTPE